MRAVLLKLLSSLYCQVMSLRLKKFIKLFKSNFQALCFQQRKPCWEYNTELRWLNLNLVWLCFILSSSDFLSKIYTRTQISLNFFQHNNIYTTKKGLFSVIVINRLYCTDLTLCRFSLGLLKVFYLFTNSTNYSWMDVLEVMPKLDLLHGFLLECYNLSQFRKVWQIFN